MHKEFLRKQEVIHHSWFLRILSPVLELSVNRTDY